MEKDRPLVVLGAGFSRAIHSAMPTTAELGAAVLDHMSLDHTTLVPFSGDLERWMSFIAVDQPWLSDGENMHNRGTFSQAAEAVNAVISSQELEVIDEPMPIWLRRLVWTWCDMEANIVTFNYDTLIERCIGSIGRVSTLGDVYAASLSTRLPVGVHRMFASEDPRGGTLRLHKMHGSTNWGFGGLTGPASDRIVLKSDRLLWQSRHRDDLVQAPRYEAQFDDLYPLIVPPTFSKGPYYVNHALRGQWRRAWDSLRNANEVTVIGYSFPTGDLTTREWLVTGLAPSSRVTVVDRDPHVVDRIRQFSLDSDIATVSGTDAVEAYVNSFCGDHVEWQIEEQDDNPPARISILVNGEEVMPQDVDQRTWGLGIEAAQRWVHERVEATSARVEKAMNIGPEGLIREHRITVLPRGRRLVI